MVEGKFSVALWSKPEVKALILDLDQAEQQFHGFNGFLSLQLGQNFLGLRLRLTNNFVAGKLQRMF